THRILLFEREAIVKKETDYRALPRATITGVLRRCGEALVGGTADACADTRCVCPPLFAAWRLRNAGLRTGASARNAAGTISRSPASLSSDATWLADKIAAGDTPYCLPIEATVSPAPTRCILHESRCSAGTSSSAAINSLP